MLYLHPARHKLETHVIVKSLDYTSSVFMKRYCDLDADIFNGFAMGVVFAVFCCLPLTASRSVVH